MSKKRLVKEQTAQGTEKKPEQGQPLRVAWILGREGARTKGGLPPRKALLWREKNEAFSHDPLSGGANEFAERFNDVDRRALDDLDPFDLEALDLGLVAEKTFAVSEENRGAEVAFVIKEDLAKERKVESKALFFQNEDIVEKKVATFEARKKEDFGGNIGSKGREFGPTTQTG